MNNPQESFRIDQIRMGPIKAVEVFTAAPPRDRPIGESLGNQTVPFEAIKDLISDKPLGRAMPDAGD